MFKALNSNNEIVGIDQAKHSNDYFCPFCKSKMIMKTGNIKVHHFAHKSAVCDDWYSDNKGPWHRYMQSLFREEYQEVILWKNNDKNSGVFHIADICIPKKDGTKLIIEFQHSPMTFEEFKRRSFFYSEECKDKNQCFFNRVIWVFDYRDKQMYFSNKNKTPLYSLKNCNYVKCNWKRPAQTLIGYKLDYDVDDYDNYDDLVSAEVLFHVTLREWKKKYNCSGFYDSYGDYQSFSRKTNSFTGEDGETFFIKPQYCYQDWKYFGGKVINEEVFFEWARQDVLCDKI